MMTAMGESSLRNLTYGDNAINPDGTVADSIGLFQQQHWWGTRSERMTPAVAAARFFQRLRTVPHWRDLPPTAAAHAVQRNADPHFYTRFLPAAEAVVDAVQPAASAALLKHSPSTSKKASRTAENAAKGTELAAGAAKKAARSVEQKAAQVTEQYDFPLPDLTALPDLPELTELPDFTGLAGAGFGDAVLDELQQSGVALPAEQAGPER